RLADEVDVVADEAELFGFAGSGLEGCWLFPGAAGRLGWCRRSRWRGGGVRLVVRLVLERLRFGGLVAAAGECREGERGADGGTDQADGATYSHRLPSPASPRAVAVRQITEASRVRLSR